MKFSKGFLSFEDQAKQLEKRGMQISDSTVHYLSHINYYRLGTYWWSFEDDHRSHSFKLGTKFDDVVELYVFDRELRLLLLDAIERIEISVRTKWAYYLAKENGAHAHENKDIFSNQFDHSAFLKTLKTEINRTSDKNVKRQLDKYDEQTPAIWISCEVMSFGLLSRSFDHLRRRALKRDIADSFRLNETVFASFLHHVTTVRNICAHHSRLWNRDFVVSMKLPRNANSNLIESLNPSAPPRNSTTPWYCAGI